MNMIEVSLLSLVILGVLFLASGWSHDRAMDRELARQKHERHQGRLRDLARIEELKAAIRQTRPKTPEMRVLWHQLYDLTHKVGAAWPPAL